ncbi:YadA C-terminal domain-containing protein [Escherichia coli]|uniref:YadA C-terminal domain-containing protein n=1 Tax=Escherichia coli TaxID=562 RepID=UPI000DE3F523|nr:YadA C-terminal domain-containing protein [Escherichia coli]EHL0457089.1 YadA-like family protein [Escherichia coli]EIB6639289.1 YadA-like family protein [Escherichia coli]EKS1295027.1 YadA-like family protein [Escherichia coli]MCK2845470.1 YadA-like family protein [Escherichia coli]MDC3600620.1 YadA-like family protein [Escherichia coli]
MSKKFTKTILSSAVAGLLLVSGGAIAQENFTRGDFSVKFYNNGDTAKIVNKNGEGIIANTVTGTITTVNKNEVNSLIEAFIKKHPKEDKNAIAQIIGERLRYTIDAPELKKENIGNITEEKLNKLKETIDIVSETITTKTARAYNTAINNGVSVESALAAVKQDSTGGLLNEFNRLGTNINKLNSLTTFELDENGEITYEKGEERIPVKDVVAELKADTTIRKNKDGSYTLDQTTPDTVRVNEAIVSLDKSIKDRTTVGVSSDGALTRAEGAKNTISVNDGLVALSGRTDRIDAAVGAIDGRVTRNTQSIEKNSKAIAANTRTLQQHSARLDSQQRQINENHKEMKRAAAQSAALTGLFQPYSVGKFNATAAVGGYSDQQALAVGVGYRFNEQTAAKAGVAFSDGDASWNVGVNFEF